MCLIVKIAANCPLPTAPVDPERRRIAVLDLNNWQGDDSYTRWMTLPYVYEVTSRYGCGCDLRLSQSELWALTDDDAGEDEEISARETVEDWQQVANVIEIGLQAGPVELFAATDSELPTVEVESRRSMTLAEIRRFDFQLVERQMVTIRQGRERTAPAK